MNSGIFTIFFFIFSLVVRVTENPLFIFLFHSFLIYIELYHSGSANLIPPYILFEAKGYL